MKQVIKYSGVAMMVGIVTFVWFGTVLAQWPSDPLVNLPICTATGNQYYPQIVADGSGGTIITWQDYRGGTYDIYAQRVNASGVVQWTANGVAICTATSHQYRPEIGADGSGGAIITWYDRRSGTYDIYAQRVNAAGVVQWTANGVAICTATNYQYYPQIGADGSGGAIITWFDRRGASYDIYAQRVNASGAVQWTANGVAICTVTNTQYYPQIAADGSGGAIITWYDYRSGTYDIYAQRVNAAGVVQWTTNGVAICTATNHQYRPEIVADGSGGAIITWYDRRTGTYDIYAQRVNASGAVQWTANGVAICTATNYQYYPQIAADGSGGAIITWYDRRSGTYDIYAQRANAAGVVQWTTNGVAICTATNYQYRPEITPDGSGGAIITWYDRRTGTYDIYAQRVNASGAVQWTANGVAICTATNYQYYPMIATDGSGGAIITWYDRRSGSNYDIYAQNVNSNGSLGAVPHPLDIVEVELSASYGPPDPWVQREFIELSFEVTAVDTSLTHVRFFSDPLQHESLPKKIPDDLVEFIPEEIGFLAEDDTAVVMVRLEIPIGQHEGNYSGYFRAICYEGFSDSVGLIVTVEPLADIDFDREKVALAAHPDGSESDLCIVVNPNSWDNNPDPVDGPGNVNLGSIRYSFTNLTGAGGTIPSSAVSVSSNQSSLGSGESDEIILTVDIPSGQLAGEYEGKAFVSGMMVAKMRHGPDMIPRPQDAVDSLTLEVTVLPQKVLNIVQNSITATVTPSNPWVEPLSAGFAFDVENTGNDTLKNVSLFSINLSLDSRDPIYAYTVAFDPPVLGSIEPGGVRQIQATVPVPIGQYNGTYSGSFSAVSGNLLGAEDEVATSLTVEPVSDLDVEDYSGNLEGNTMILTGVKEGIALGTFTIVNPNSWDNNADLFDGPANCDLDDLEWESTDLRICGKGAKCKGVTMVEFKNLGPGADIMVICKGVIYFQGYVLHDSTFVASNDPDKLGTNTEIWVNGSLAEKVHTSCSKPIYVGMVWGDFELVDLTKIYSKKESIPAANVEVAFTGNGDLDSGEGVKGLVEINIPKGVKHWKHDYDHAYCGTITISGSAFGTTVSDNFRVLLRVIKGDTGWAMSGFWGENEGAAIVLHWSGLSDLEANGYAVYRNDVKIVDLPASVYGYTDHVSTRATYDYRLGVQVGGSKIMIGPITIGCILPTVFSLSQNEPNPVRNHTSIRYTVAEAGNVTIEVYNSVGMLVRTVVNEYKTPGVYTVNWEKIDLANGVYFYNMSAGGFSVSRKMVVLR